MKVELKPGKSVDVVFAESDGEITVAFTETEISVSTDWPDATGRVGKIYSEVFGPSELVDGLKVPVDEEGRLIAARVDINYSGDDHG